MERKPNESFAAYRIRRAAENKRVREYLKGRVVWLPQWGTYRKVFGKDGSLLNPLV